MRSLFLISIRHFLWLASVLLFLGFLIVCIVCLSSINGIAFLSSEVSNKTLPTLVENQQALLAVEKLRLSAEIVNRADDHEARRLARIRAEAMSMDSSFVSGSDYEQMGRSLIFLIRELADYRDSAQMSKLRLQNLALDYASTLVEMATHSVDPNLMKDVLKAYRETSFPKAGTEGISAKSVALAQQLKKTDATNANFIQTACEQHAQRKPELAPLCSRQKRLYKDYAQIQELQSENIIAISNLWEKIDIPLRGMQDIVTGDAEYMVTKSLASIENASTEAVFTILFMLLAGVGFYIFYHLLFFWFVVRPLRWTGRKLRDLQQGNLETPPLSIWIEEIHDMADLLHRFGLHISELDSHASLMAEDAAERHEVMISVFKVSVDGYDIWCPDGDYFINDELLRLLGLSDVDQLMTCWDETRFASQEQLKALLEEVQESGYVRGETTLRSLAGELIPFEVTRMPIRRRGQKCILSYYRDLRQQKSIERELRQARDEAREASKIKSKFLARMSHELRTPMNGILGMTHLALAETLPPGVAVYCRKIKESAKILLRLIDDILDFSTMDSGRFSLQYAEFSYSHLLEIVGDLFRDQAREKGLDCLVKTDPRIPEQLFGDAPRLSQLLLHLCSNAVKFTSHGQVSLSCSLAEDLDDRVRLSFTVSDTGIGMSAEQISHLFQPFTQVDTSSTRRYDGAGLGLVIAQFLVEKMEGTLHVQTEPSSGTTVHFTALLHKAEEWNVIPGTEQPMDREAEVFTETPPRAIAHKNNNPPLPDAEDALEVPARHASLVEGSPGAATCDSEIAISQRSESDSPVLQGTKILLVEDNILNQEIACALLEGFGMHVLLAENGAEAVSLLEKEDVDCVLMDIQMPVMDGHAAAKAIRELGRDVPIIAMTAYATEDNRVECFASGMNDFETKPIDVTQIKAKLELWIGSRK